MTRTGFITSNSSSHQEKNGQLAGTHRTESGVDIPTAPTVVDITVDGRPIKAVALITKQAWVYVFDRVTGEPVWPIEERPVPQSDVPGEKSSPTQPFPTKPAPFDRQGFSTDDLIDFTLELRAAAETIVSEYRIGPMFTPPSLRGANGVRGTLLMPALTGGGNWQGGAVDPETGIIYIPSVNQPDELRDHAPGPCCWAGWAAARRYTTR